MQLSPAQDNILRHLLPSRNSTSMRFDEDTFDLIKPKLLEKTDKTTRPPDREDRIEFSIEGCMTWSLICTALPQIVYILQFFKTCPKYEGGWGPILNINLKRPQHWRISVVGYAPQSGRKFAWDIFTSNVPVNTTITLRDLIFVW